jgi:hypothetical protein
MAPHVVPPARMLTCTVDRTVVAGTLLLVGRTAYGLRPYHNQPLGSLRDTALADCAGLEAEASRRLWLALIRLPEALSYLS